MDVKKEYAKIIRKANNWNAKVQAIVDKCGTDEIYLDKSSTIISAPEQITMIQVVSQEDENLILENNQSRWSFPVEYDPEYQEYYLGGSAWEFTDDLSYMLRCCKNGQKFYESEDPDRFLETDDDSDEDE